MLQFLARRFDTGAAVRMSVDDGRVVRAEALPMAATGLPWVSPGWVDLQVNGYGGQEFSSPALTAEKVTQIARQHLEFGVTQFCPTLTTQSLEVLSHGLSQIDAACQQDDQTARLVPGIHLEGPYFSPEDGPRGAHPREHCRRPVWDDFRRLQDAAGGRICILTMSPEFDEAPEFIAQVVASGVLVSIGHTGASGEQIRAAVDAGASMSTHLGNGAHRMLRRHPNYLWDQLAEDRLVASLIVDGAHLPSEVVKTMVRAKTPARIVLVSDVSGLAGLPAGKYVSSGCELEILPDGRLVIAGQDQLLAGASLPIGIGLANVMRFAGVDLPTAVTMVTCGPAALIGARCGGLRPGDPADLVLFELDLADPRPPRVLATLVSGELGYGQLPAA